MPGALVAQLGFSLEADDHNVGKIPILHPRCTHDLVPFWCTVVKK